MTKQVAIGVSVMLGVVTGLTGATSDEERAS